MVRHDLVAIETSHLKLETVRLRCHVIPSFAADEGPLWQLTASAYAAPPRL
jgi:hypothetical protein